MEWEATRDHASTYSRFFDKNPGMLVPEMETANFNGPFRGADAGKGLPAGPVENDPYGVPRLYGQADPSCKGMRFLLRGDSVFQDAPESKPGRVKGVSNAAGKTQRRLLRPKASSSRLPPLALTQPSPMWNDPHHAFKEARSARQLENLDFETKSLAFSDESVSYSEAFLKKKSPRAKAAIAKIMTAANLVKHSGLKGPMALGHMLKHCLGSLEAAFQAMDLTKSGRISQYQWTCKLGLMGLDCPRICGASAEAIFKILDEMGKKELKLENVIKHCEVDPGHIPRKRPPLWAEKYKQFMSNEFGVKIRGELKALTPQSRQYELPEDLTMQQARTVRLVADSLGLWISIPPQDWSYSSGRVAISNEDDFVALVCAALPKLGSGGSLSFPKTLSELQCRIVQALATDRGLWWSWELDAEQDWNLVVHDIGNWALEVRRKILQTVKANVCEFLEPMSSTQVAVVRMIAAEAFCVAKIQAIPGEVAKFTAVVRDKSSFISQARSHLEQVGDAEVSIELQRLDPAEKVMLHALAADLGRRVTVDPDISSPQSITRIMSQGTLDMTLSRVSSTSKFTNASKPQFIIGYPLLAFDEMEALLLGTSVEEATPPEDSSPDAHHVYLVRRAWRRCKVVKAIFDEYVSEEQMGWQEFWDFCEDRSVADIGQSRLRDFYNATLDKQVLLWGSSKGLRLEYLALLLHEIAAATSWSNVIVAQLAT